jgi:hypothetical protein
VRRRGHHKLFVGYRQWKRQPDTTRTSDFRAERQKTYKELWEKLEDVHVRLRTKAVETEEFRPLLRDVNSYILTACTLRKTIIPGYHERK